MNTGLNNAKFAFKFIFYFTFMVAFSGWPLFWHDMSGEYPDCVFELSLMSAFALLLIIATLQAPIKEKREKRENQDNVDFWGMGCAYACVIVLTVYLIVHAVALEKQQQEIDTGY